MRIDTILANLSEDTRRYLNRRTEDFKSWHPDVKLSDEEWLRVSFIHELLSDECNRSGGVLDVVAAVAPRDHRALHDGKFKFAVNIMKAFSAELKAERVDGRNHCTCWGASHMVTAYNRIDWKSRKPVQ